MDEAVREHVLKRLNYIAGHLNGIRKMTKEDRYCVDILKQSYAVRKSLEKLEVMLLEAHLRSCVVEGLTDGDERRLIDELLDLYAQVNR